jgi:hypothetical protein
VDAGPARQDGEKEGGDGGPQTGHG